MRMRRLNVVCWSTYERTNAKTWPINGEKCPEKCLPRNEKVFSALHKRSKQTATEEYCQILRSVNAGGSRIIASTAQIVSIVFGRCWFNKISNLLQASNGFASLLRNSLSTVSHTQHTPWSMATFDMFFFHFPYFRLIKFHTRLRYDISRSKIMENFCHRTSDLAYPFLRLAISILGECYSNARCANIYLDAERIHKQFSLQY